MIYEQSTKKVALEPQSFTNGASATLVIDRENFDYCTIDILLGRANATSSVPTTMEVQEADINAATNFTNFTNANLVASNTSGTTSNTFTNLVPAAVLTNGVTEVNVNIDCRTRKRYLQLTVIPSTTEVIAAVATLSRAKNEAATAADANVALQVIG